MTRILKKMPSHQGVVYRGMRVSNKDLEKVQIGKTYRVDKHSSASTSKHIASAFADSSGKSAVILQLDQRSGRKIPRLYTDKGEREVVLMRGSRFKVTENRPGRVDGEDFLIIRMKEI